MVILIIVYVYVFKMYGYIIYCVCSICGYFRFIICMVIWYFLYLLLVCMVCICIKCSIGLLYDYLWISIYMYVSTYRLW